MFSVFHNRITSALTGASLAALLCAPAFAQDIADTIYSGGPILTMEDAAPRAEALATKDGRILAVGSLAEVLVHQGENTARYDLAGRTLLPGFVDSHGHVVMGGLQALSANLLAPPDGAVTDIASLQDALRNWMAENQSAIAATNLIVGFGYDQSQLAELRHPTKTDLDAVSQDIPIIIVHQSGHFGAANSAALAVADITKTTAVPPGGIIRYGADGSPDGVLEENAFFLVLGKLLGGIGEEGFKDFARAGAKLWARFGYTTAQEGRATPQVAAIARAVAAEGGIPVDVVVYPDVLVDRDFILANHSDTYENGVRIGGAKLTIDGSPQGFTALRDRPYHDPIGNYPPGYAGYAAANPEQVQDAINWAFEHNIQILTHANGEGASDMLLAAIEAAEQTHGTADRRPVLIHGQFLRRDQVAALHRLNVFPSLFPMHTFYWGDWHRDRTVGPINADNISPTGWVRDRGMMFGTHHDAPVAFPDSMRVLSATVTRRTRSGDILGPDQRVDVMTALKAMTLWPAYQHFEEAKKGSLKAGKQADFVILSADPTGIDPEALDDIKVQVTIKADAEIYRAETGPQKASLIPPMGHHVLDVAHAAARRN
ncbi:amidohydrolase [Shimia sp. R11_0]|uniref:amidohydrolase n=1 Tax=Shimia sp. R11_0 TaxID=2821096 RepID=UPI001ADAE727|nr:amidohydrolase [Shimia sp. R11_0]MBO9476665.1 amidohydrolase [Shimia sp. R11_0]